MLSRGYLARMSTISIPGLGGSSVSVSLHTEFDGAARVDLAAFTSGRAPVVVSFADVRGLIEALTDIQSTADAMPKPNRKQTIVFSGTGEAEEQYRSTMVPFLRIIDGGKATNNREQPCAS